MSRVISHNAQLTARSNLAIFLRFFAIKSAKLRSPVVLLVKRSTTEHPERHVVEPPGGTDVLDLTTEIIMLPDFVMAHHEQNHKSTATTHFNYGTGTVD